MLGRFGYMINMFLMLLISVLTAKANVGQPGIWQAGGEIRLIFASDSVASKFIQLESERIDIHVYSGFSVIKGRYKLVNTGDRNITFTMGYPVNALWKGEDSEEPFGYSFWLDSLAGFRVKIDGIDNSCNINNTSFHHGKFHYDRWITWLINFEPGRCRTIEVTYLTPTDQASITNFSGQNKANGIMYIFESGAMWKGVIENAELYVHFTDGLSSEDVIGIRPNEDIFLIEEDDILFLKRENWKPSAEDNFFILYQSRNHKYYTLKEALEDKTQLLNKIDLISNANYDTSSANRFICEDIPDSGTHSLYTKVVIYLLGSIILLFLFVFLIVSIIKIGNHERNRVEFQNPFS